MMYTTTAKEATDEVLTILEGKWEEILHHQDELAGKRVRLIVLPETEKTPEEPLPKKSLLDRIGNLVGSVQGEPIPATQVEQVLEEIIYSKHSRGRKIDSL